MAIIDKTQNILLLKIALIILLVQNFLIVASPIVGPDFFNLVWYIDIIGFLLLGVGYVLYSMHEVNEKKNLFLLGGLLIVGWVIFRILWQFILIQGLNITDVSIEAIEDFVGSLISMMYSFILGAVVLGVGSVLIWKAQDGQDGLFFMIFGVVNLAAVLMIFFPLFGATAETADTGALLIVIGFLIKLLVVPVLGIIAFFLMFQNSDKLAA